MKTIAPLAIMFVAADVPGETSYRTTLIVTSELPSGNVPMDPSIDLRDFIADAKLPGIAESWA